MRRGCMVHLYDHTEYTRNRALQTVRAFLYDHVRPSPLCAIPRLQRGLWCKRGAEGGSDLPRAFAWTCRTRSAAPVGRAASRVCAVWRQVANGYLLKMDVEELIGRIVLVHSLAEALEKAEATAPLRELRHLLPFGYRAPLTRVFVRNRLL